MAASLVALCDRFRLHTVRNALWRHFNCSATLEGRKAWRPAAFVCSFNRFILNSHLQLLIYLKGDYAKKYFKSFLIQHFREFWMVLN